MKNCFTRIKRICLPLKWHIILDIIFSVFLVFNNLAHAKSSAESKNRESFLIQCQGTYLLALSRQTALSPKQYSEHKAFIKDVCGEITKGWEAKGHFKDMKDPMFQGCFQGVGLVYSDKMEPKKRKELTDKLLYEECADLKER